MRRATTDPSVTSRGRTPEPGPAIAAAFAGGDRWRMAAAHSAKFQAVSAPTTAANWWLLRVARQLRALNAANSKSRNGLSRQAPSSTSASAAPRFFDRLGAFALPPAAFPFAGRPPPLSPSGDGRNRVETVQRSGNRKLRAPRTI